MSVFEQPATEQIRFCLRLEHLKQQLQLSRMGTGFWDSYHCVCAIVDILRLLDRHDLRTKLNQELSRLLMVCRKLSNLPHIDRDKLALLQEQIDHHCTMIHQAKGMFAQDLRDNEFIQTIYRFHMHPGGTCRHQAPGFHLWLMLPSEQRHQDIETWLKSFNDIFAITGMILQIIRDSGAPKRYRAESGFFQMPLDPQNPAHLIRIEYPSELSIYPKVSTGRHGLSVRFLEFKLDNPAEQSPLNIEFMLTLCQF